MWLRAASLVGLLLSHQLICISRQLAPANPTHTLRGTVVNSVTGEPVQRVLVQLEGNPQRHVLTGADGKFEFQSVAPGSAVISLRKPGYFTEHTRSRGLPPWVTVGPHQLPVVLNLVPEAVISGHVLGDGGEPAEGLPVQVFGDRIENGRKTWNIVSSTQTNDLGEFRCANLPPGRYYVFAGPSSGTASLTPRVRAQARARMRARGGGQPVARGYPGVFYPAAEDRNSATLLEVRAGQHVEVNFNVASQIFHTISGTVTGYLTGNVGLDLQAANAAGTQINANFDFDAKKGTFGTQWLPPGRYVLSAEMRDNDGHASYATLDVTLASDLSGVHLQLLPGAAIPVTFQLEKTRSDSPDIGISVETRRRFNSFERREGYYPARVVLTPVDNSPGKSQRQYSSQLAEGVNSGVEIPGLPSGTYSVRVYANGPYYAASVQCGSVNVLEQNLTVTAGAAVQPIDIVLRDDYGHLRGSVKMPGDADSALVFAVSEDGARPVQNTTASRPPLPMRDGGLASSFAFQLPPGTYRVFAIGNADDFEYGDAEELRKYADRGRVVTIAAGQDAKVELDLVRLHD